MIDVTGLGATLAINYLPNIQAPATFESISGKAAAYGFADWSWRAYLIQRERESRGRFQASSFFLLPSNVQLLLHRLHSRSQPRHLSFITTLHSL